MPLLSDRTYRYTYGPNDDRLSDFYIPSLAASVRYDRMTGYFSSHALAIAAAGVAHFIAGGGTMRMLVGAQLSHEDVEAIEAGYDPEQVIAARITQALPAPEALEARLRNRLAALAWMVARGALEIRVVLPTTAAGLPRPAAEARDYFHPKVGVFTDTEGNQVAFNGSINESETGWEHNYELFTVFSSWTPEGRVYVAEQVNRFARLWEHREKGWLSLPVPDAVRQSLLRYTPPTAPTHDPLEVTPAITRETGKPIVLAPELDRERILIRFLQDLPHLVGGEGIGAATAAVEPWPHQRSVARRVIETYPARYLLCDEVGLGKTIEAGLALRELLLRGTAQRALILAPKSVLRQWQEELYEKFTLNVPIYNGKLFVDYWGTQEIPITGNPWNGVTTALVSSQLVKRRDRCQTLLDADPWDLILVDEAHHARRRDFLDMSSYRPNRLLDLLNQLQSRTRSLLLMTATPMQVAPVEVWDLLNLLGLSGEWGADGRNFLRFYAELRSDEPDWDFVLRMFREERAAQSPPAIGTGHEPKGSAKAASTAHITRQAPDNDGLDPDWARRAEQILRPVRWAQLKQIMDDPNPGRAFAKLPDATRQVALDGIKRTTPLRRLVFRNTRPLLRDYVKRGLLHDRVPFRRPQLEWIDMREEERELYLRIEEYISNFYRKYEEKRKGLGFVMTVYRRRLTSSFYAVRCSLERRLAFLRGQAGLDFDEDDLEQDALSLDLDEEELESANADYRDEIAYVEDFLHQLRMVSGYDSKVTRLLADLDAVFRERDTVLVFTQYTDTMDFLREQLRQGYGSQVACYSGRGGEWWDGNTWVPITKEELKNAFREGKRIKILLATDAASEGLNLQTCGVLINYDMPWNPMRVEQRIGRIDRIGQHYERVWIRNYFYRDTVEAKVYQALENRIGWFQDVVGPLQPILALVGRTIQRVAMAGNADRRRILEEELAEINAAYDNLSSQLDLDTWSSKASAERAAEDLDWPAPITLPELAAVVLGSSTLSTHFRPHEWIDGAHWLSLDGKETAITFDRRAIDAHPNSLQLLTYGNPLLDELLTCPALPEVTRPTAVEEPGVPPFGILTGLGQGERVMNSPARGTVLRIAVESPLPRIAYYTQDTGGTLKPITNLAELGQALEMHRETSWTPAATAKAKALAQEAASAEWDYIQQGQARLRHVQREALIARIGRLLLDAAIVEIALGQQPSMFGDQAYPSAFTETAVTGLKRHGYPWAPLLVLAWTQMPLRRPRATDSLFITIQNESPDYLKRRFQHLTTQALQLLNELATLPNQTTG